ncbi:hypothetical protein [Streptomyces griseorubiginosus]|uniref:hypothetical protein n=1 Tax=Streptomyces griseorubiginosus TaxID=67304 RepID=UPI0036ED8825
MSRSSRRPCRSRRATPDHRGTHHSHADVRAAVPPHLSNLSAAADRWEETVTKFKSLHTAFGDEVAKPFQQAGWRQPVLTAAKADSDVRAAQQEFADAQKEAEGISGVLASLHAKRLYQDTTNEAQSEAGRSYTHGETALREAVRADIARSGGSVDLQDAVGREVDQSHAAGAEWGDQYHG